MQQGLKIERPRSALHSGDFTQDTSASQYNGARKQDMGIPASESYHPDRHAWFATSPPRDFIPFKFERRIPFPDLPDRHRSSPSSASSSLSSSFVYMHPTSPLVQSQSNDDSSICSMELDSSTPTRAPRRQTIYSYYSPQNVPITSQKVPSMSREGAFPYRAHQPRKSLTSVPNPSLLGTSPQTAMFAGSRRTSVGLESSSPLQQTSMVGSYEESILRGRMSTTPSKPLDFLAQIGVLGLGNCKSSLRCPAHVTLPFPAVFYSYASTPHGRSKSDDGPSPYVGQIDLENGLPNQEDSRARRRSHQRSGSVAKRVRAEASNDTEMTGIETTVPGARDVAKQRRRTGSSPKAPPGGSYRIPEKGQIQIIIKNQNKTAVKLFLVPYDLAGMEPGTKTFIRQRSYSGGSVVDGVPSDAAANERPILRYLVHLHICSPARGRYYLYKSIRVVFANRVPDGKEKLRNEVTLPEPKFSPYKAIRVMHPPATQQMNGPGASLAAEKAFRRRSSGYSFSYQGRVPPFGPNEPMLGQSIGSRSLASLPSPVAEVPLGTSGFVPLNFAKGEVVGYSNGNGANGTIDGTMSEGLLSQRLRSLGMGMQMINRKTSEDGGHE